MTEQNSPDRTILVVDDEPVNIQVLSRKLKLEGLGVLTARNGQEGLELARSGSPDLILLDIMMPGMDGFEVCQRLREDERTKSIPVIFVTAQNSKKGSKPRRQSRHPSEQKFQVSGFIATAHSILRGMCRIS